MVSYKYSGKDDPDKNIQVTFFEIENEETFHMKNLYKLMREWLIEENFTDMYGEDPSASNQEALYLERLFTTGSKEHRIWWRCFKYPRNLSPTEGMSKSFYRYYLKIDFMTLNMKSIEVMHQGHKMKTDRGDVIIKIWAFIQLDFRGDFARSPFLTRWWRMFRYRIYKAQVESYRIDLYKITYRLQNIIKQYLKLKTLYEMPKAFHPEKGV